MRRGFGGQAAVIDAPEATRDCAYLDEQGRCSAKQMSPPPEVCRDCRERVGRSDPKFTELWRDPLVVLDRRRTPASDQLRGLLAGGSAFLMGGGPSANELPLELLARRGCWTLGVNNAAGHPRVRPQAFVCSDPPQKFSHSVWLDPAVMKFVPTPKLGGSRCKLRRKVEGRFEPLDRTVSQCPNVWAFERWSWLWPDRRFFEGDGAMWGNHSAGVERTGQPKTVCTMLLGLRLLYFLGARRVYLVGVDFRMGPGYGYSFGQERDASACATNNSQFHVVNGWLCEMVRVRAFEAFGLEVFNCFEHSGLRAFPYVPFEEAVAEARGLCEDVPDLSGWYQK